MRLALATTTLVVIALIKETLGVGFRRVEKNGLSKLGQESSLKYLKAGEGLEKVSIFGDDGPFYFRRRSKRRVPCGEKLYCSREPTTPTRTPEGCEDATAGSGVKDSGSSGVSAPPPSKMMRDQPLKLNGWGGKSVPMFTPYLGDLMHIMGRQPGWHDTARLAEQTNDLILKNIKADSKLIDLHKSRKLGKPLLGDDAGVKGMFHQFPARLQNSDILSAAGGDGINRGFALSPGRINSTHLKHDGSTQRQVMPNGDNVVQMTVTRTLPPILLRAIQNGAPGAPIRLMTAK